MSDIFNLHCLRVSSVIVAATTVQRCHHVCPRVRIYIDKDIGGRFFDNPRRVRGEIWDQFYSGFGLLSAVFFDPRSLVYTSLLLGPDVDISWGDKSGDVKDGLCNFGEFLW